jgi:hypothetical protein
MLGTYFCYQPFQNYKVGFGLLSEVRLKTQDEMVKTILIIFILNYTLFWKVDGFTSHFN